MTTSVSVIPDLIDALLAQAETALPDHLVFDGYDDTDEPGDSLMVGVEDPDFEDAATSASSTQSAVVLNAALNREESVEINCAALSISGDNDPKDARDRAFATVAAVATLLRGSSVPILGVPGTYAGGVVAVQLLQNKTFDAGASALVFFRLGFMCRI